MGKMTGVGLVTMAWLLLIPIYQTKTLCMSMKNIAKWVITWR